MSLDYMEGEFDLVRSDVKSVGWVTDGVLFLIFVFFLIYFLSLCC